MKTVVVIALAGALALAPEAHGKSCMRITTTTPVVAGMPVRIALTTMLPSYAADGSLRKLTPYPAGASVDVDFCNAPSWPSSTHHPSPKPARPVTVERPVRLSATRQLVAHVNDAPRRPA